MALDIGMRAMDNASSSPNVPVDAPTGVFTCGMRVRSDDFTVSISHQISTMHAADADPLEEAVLCGGTEAGGRGSVLSNDA